MNEFRSKRVLNLQLLVGISVVIALIIVNVFVTQNSSQDQRSATSRVIQTLDILGHLDAVLALIAEAESAQRSFVLTNDRAALEPYTSAAHGIEDRIDIVRNLTADNPPQTARLVHLRELVQDRLRQMNGVLAISHDHGLLAARQALILDNHKETMAAIRVQIAALKGTESALLEQRLESAATGYRRAYGTNVAAGSIGLLALAALVLLVDRNLRARQAAAAEIMRQRETLRVTLASIGDGVITTDVSGRVIYLNREAETLTGWNSEDAAGHQLEGILTIIHEESRQPVENPATRALREGIVVSLAHQTVLIGKDGAERPIDDIAAPIRDAQGRVAGVVLVFRDVTEEREATNQLRKLATELSEADERKNEFLAMLAHEIRNPLGAIRNSAAVLKLAGHDPQALAAAQGAIHRQMEHLVRLVDDLLDVSRISHGKLELRRSRMDLRPALEQAIEACRPTYEKNAQAFEVEIPDTPLYVNGDATRITQAIGNLLSNAGKFTPRGGRIQLSAGLENGQVFVRIRDNGMGIAATDLPRLFDMFSQIDTSLERSQGGLGIGLNLVKQLVEMHGGRVEARSEGIGRGSEFVVQFPVLTEAAADLQLPASLSVRPIGDAARGRDAAVAVARPPHSGRRILVVDDNVDSADSLAMLLRLHGHDAQVVHDGLDAVEVALRTLPEVVLLDIGLPRLNGYEAARRIRLSPQGRQTRLVAITGWGQAEDRKLSSAAGFEEHFVKPVDYERLLALLAQPWSLPTAS